MTATIPELLVDGDWACAHAEHGTLATVAQSLTEMLEGDALQLAREVVLRASRELSVAFSPLPRLSRALLGEHRS